MSWTPRLVTVTDKHNSIIVVSMCIVKANQVLDSFEQIQLQFDFYKRMETSIAYVYRYWDQFFDSQGRIAKVTQNQDWSVSRSIRRYLDSLYPREAEIEVFAILQDCNNTDNVVVLIEGIQ